MIVKIQQRLFSNAQSQLQLLHHFPVLRNTAVLPKEQDNPLKFGFLHRQYRYFHLPTFLQGVLYLFLWLVLLVLVQLKHLLLINILKNIKLFVVQ